MPSTDEEFERLWNTVDPMWKTGDKGAARYFWLEGRQRELQERLNELSKITQEVRNAGSRS